MEEGSSCHEIITENIIQEENRAKVDKALQETDSKLVAHCSEQETTIQSEDHNQSEEKSELLQKTDEKPLETNLASAPKEDDKDIILIEDVVENKSSTLNSAVTCETDGHDRQKKINTNFEKIKNNNQIKSKIKKNSKREASTTTKLENPEFFSSFTMPDFGIPLSLPHNFQYFYQPIAATPLQFLAAFTYSQEALKPFAYNLNTIQSSILMNPVALLMQNQLRQNMINELKNKQIHQFILEQNRDLNKNRSNDVIFIDDIQKPEAQLDTKPPEIKPAKGDKADIPVEIKKESKKNSRNNRKQARKAKVKAEISDDNSEESPQMDNEERIKEVERPNDKGEVIRKRRKFNRTGIDIEPQRSERKLVYEDYIFNIHFEDKDKEGIVETSVGPNFQAEIPDYDLNEELVEKPKRKLKLIWNPEEFSKEKIDGFFKMLKDNVECTTLHQERAIKLYKKYGMDSNKLLEHIKKNPLFYKNYFEVRSYQSILRQRNNAH